MSIDMLRCVFILVLAVSVPAAPLPLMPLPVAVKVSPGKLKIDATFSVGASGYSDFRLEGAIKRFRLRVARQTGIPIVTTSVKRVTLLVECRERGNDYPTLGEDESYQLDITTNWRAPCGQTP